MCSGEHPPLVQESATAKDACIGGGGGVGEPNLPPHLSLAGILSSNHLRGPTLLSFPGHLILAAYAPWMKFMTVSIEINVILAICHPAALPPPPLGVVVGRGVVGGTDVTEFTLLPKS